MKIFKNNSKNVLTNKMKSDNITISQKNKQKTQKLFEKYSNNL